MIGERSRNAMYLFSTKLIAAPARGRHERRGRHRPAATRPGGRAGRRRRRCRRRHRSRRRPSRGDCSRRPEIEHPMCHAQRLSKIAAPSEESRGGELTILRWSEPPRASDTVRRRSGRRSGTVSARLAGHGDAARREVASRPSRRSGAAPSRSTIETPRSPAIASVRSASHSSASPPAARSSSCSAAGRGVRDERRGVDRARRARLVELRDERELRPVGRPGRGVAVDQARARHRHDAVRRADPDRAREAVSSQSAVTLGTGSAVQRGAPCP